MFPMVSGLEEFRAARKILNECMDELRKENRPFDEKIEVGLMIEVPSAALVVDYLAQEADFMSIGTNDLIQYTLAVDRVNDEVSHLYEPLHPAILRLIHQTVKAGHAAGKWVGMCGEMAGDADMTPILLGLELDELSVSPGLVPKIKKVIRESKFADCHALVTDVLKDPSRDNVQGLLRRFRNR
jgi:phosphotransferase system enzyme I (PtsI)